MDQHILLGNEAVALALVEQGCRVVTAYPGTPSSEIMAGVVKHKKRLDREIYTEWSANEKVALEVGLAASWTGLRTAVAMKQVGLNVAADPFFSAAYTGVKGGFVVVVADDPGLHSSQTEQDSRLMALNAKVPVLDPASPLEAREMVATAFELSERYGVPIMLRLTTRLSHAVQGIPLDYDPSSDKGVAKARFRRDPSRWAAAPKARAALHVVLNDKLTELETELDESPLNTVVNASSGDRVGIIASGVVFHTAEQSLAELGVTLPILKIATPYPLPRKLVADFVAGLDKVLVLEETAVCMELQMPDRGKVHGRLDGTVPGAGELTPELVVEILTKLLTEHGYQLDDPSPDAELQALINDIPLPMRRPRLCPGCAHRSAFFAVKREFGPRAIYPGDIGCYTLGINLRAVDTVVDMGASIAMASGFYQANKMTGDKRPIVASIGDSTFLASGITPLLNAVHVGSRFVLVILDNHTTAMTGFQPTAANDSLADGGEAPRQASLAGLARACGADFVREMDPYDHDAYRQTLREAYEYTLADDGGVAVIIANRPCVLYDRSPVYEQPVPVVITDECDGCRFCTEAFECPALVLVPERNIVEIDYKICIDCGQCIDACYKGFIVPQLEDEVTRGQGGKVTG